MRFERDAFTYPWISETIWCTSPPDGLNHGKRKVTLPVTGRKCFPGTRKGPRIGDLLAWTVDRIKATTLRSVERSISILLGCETHTSCKQFRVCRIGSSESSGLVSLTHMNSFVCTGSVAMSTSPTQCRLYASRLGSKICFPCARK